MIFNFPFVYLRFQSSSTVPVSMAPMLSAEPEAVCQAQIVNMVNIKSAQYQYICYCLCI